MNVSCSNQTFNVRISNVHCPLGGLALTGISSTYSFPPWHLDTHMLVLTSYYSILEWEWRCGYPSSPKVLRCLHFYHKN